MLYRLHLCGLGHTHSATAGLLQLCHPRGPSLVEILLVQTLDLLCTLINKWYPSSWLENLEDLGVTCMTTEESVNTSGRSHRLYVIRRVGHEEA